MVRIVNIILVTTIVVSIGFIFQNNREINLLYENALPLSQQVDSLNKARLKFTDETLKSMYDKVRETLDEHDIKIFKSSLKLKKEISPYLKNFNSLKEHYSNNQIRNDISSEDLILNLKVGFQLLEDEYKFIRDYLDISELAAMSFEKKNELTYTDIITMESEFLKLFISIIDYKKSQIGAECFLSNVPDMIMKMNEQPTGIVRFSPRLGKYQVIKEHVVKHVSELSESMFSVDIENGYFDPLKKALSYDLLPLEEDLQTEELINYFDYSFDQKPNQEPISVYSEVNKCPWDSSHHLLMVGLDARKKENLIARERPSRNYTFLIDFSSDLKYSYGLEKTLKALKSLMDTWSPNENISIGLLKNNQVYRWYDKRFDSRQKLLDSIQFIPDFKLDVDTISIQDIYSNAFENHDASGDNQVIILADEDFGNKSFNKEQMNQIVRSFAKRGLKTNALLIDREKTNNQYLTKLTGIGKGDVKMIITESEAEYVFKTSLNEKVLPVADDVNPTVTFNKNVVKSYRLIGYENRLQLYGEYEKKFSKPHNINSSFHMVAMYELVLADSIKSNSKVASINIDYKLPNSSKKRIISKQIFKSFPEIPPTNNFLLSSSAASFGLVLKKSPYKGIATYQSIADRMLSVPDMIEDYQWKCLFDLVKRAEQTSEELLFE